MICSRRGYWVSAIIFALLFVTGSPSGAEAASALAKGKKSVSTAKPKVKVLVKALAKVKNPKAVAALKKNGVKNPKSNNGKPPYKDPVVTPVVGPVDGGGSAGGGAVPEPALWMGLAGCAAVMLAAGRWRRSA